MQTFQMIKGPRKVEVKQHVKIHQVFNPCVSCLNLQNGYYCSAKKIKTSCIREDLIPTFHFEQNIIDFFGYQKGFWNVDVNYFGMFQQQLDNIFPSKLACIHKGSPSSIVSCIQLNSVRMVQEEFDNIFVSISTCPHKWSPSIFIFGI